MVFPTEFLDPFQDDIVAFPINTEETAQWNTNIGELIVGAVIFLSLASIYNAAYGIWQALFQQKETVVMGDLKESNDVFVRVTFAILTIIIAYLVVWYFGPTRGRLTRAVTGRRTRLRNEL